MLVTVFAIREGLSSGLGIINTSEISHTLDNYVTMKDGSKYYVQDADMLRIKNILTEDQFGTYSLRHD